MPSLSPCCDGFLFGSPFLVPDCVGFQLQVQYCYMDGFEHKLFHSSKAHEGDGSGEPKQSDVCMGVGSQNLTQLL